MPGTVILGDGAEPVGELVSEALTCPGGHMTPTIAPPVGTPPPDGHRTRPAALSWESPPDS